MAVAQFAERRGIQSRFLVSETWPGLDEFARASRLKLQPVGDDDLTTTLRSTKDADIAIVDGYGFDHDYVAALRHEMVTAVIDDLADRPLAADVVVNPNPYAGELTYDVPGAAILAGPQYALLRPAFAEARMEAEKSAAVERIFVMLGGSDPTGELPTVLQAVGFFDGRVDVVTALSGDQLQTIRRAAEAVAGDVTVHCSVRDPAKLMAHADLAITAAGGASWELACLGVPAIEVVVAGNQREVGRWLSETGIARVTSSPVDREWLEDEVRSLIGDVAERNRMSERARELIDGCGADRVLDLLEELA